MIRHGSFVHAVVRGPSVHTFRIRELHRLLPRHVVLVYTYDSYGGRQKKIACVYSTTEILEYLPSTPPLPPAGNLARATEISVKRFSCVRAAL